MIQRRDLLLATSATAAAGLLTASTTVSADEATIRDTTLPVQFALNTSTIRGQQLPLEKQIQVTAAAGYDAIEPWMRDVQTFVDRGGKLSELKKRIGDAGLFVASAIGFANWISDDEATRKEGLENARRDMEMVAELGGHFIAAPPIGAHRSGSISPPLLEIASRYRALCEVGQATGVRPQLELWGFSPTLHRLSEMAYVATEAAHPAACVLPDFYHIYKGGNDFEGLNAIEASMMHCFHINDYPAEPAQAEIADKHRVYPGDGVCPLPKIIRRLIDNGFSGTFSLELFNPDYWKQDALEVASLGLQKSRAVVLQAVALS